MPSELDVRALLESNMRPELIAIAEAEGVTYSERGDKRHIATEILEAREAVKAASAAFLAAGQVDGPERKARREAKAKLYALLA